MSKKSSGIANGRAPAQRIVSGARTAPYARPEPARKAAETGAGQQWPTTQLSIRGASGPTWIVVSNLLRGTSEADINETFRQFGNIEAVRPHKANADTERALSFEIAFTHASSAQGAIDKLNGALADGQVLSVQRRDAVPVKPAASSSAIPTGPRRELLASGGAGGPTPGKGRELLGNGPQAGRKVAAGGMHKQAPAGNLHSRILSAAELKALAKKQEKAKRVIPGVHQPSPASLALSQRIGSLPLAMRLSDTTAATGYVVHIH